MNQWSGFDIRYPVGREYVNSEWQIQNSARNLYLLVVL